MWDAVRSLRPWPYGFFVLLGGWLGFGGFDAALGVAEGLAGRLGGGIIGLLVIGDFRLPGKGNGFCYLYFPCLCLL